MLLFAFRHLAKADYYGGKELVINKPTCDPVKAAGQSQEDCFYHEPPRPKPVVRIKKASIGGYKAYSCVLYALAKAGIKPMGLGAAKNYPTNSQTPKIGGVVIFYIGRYGHMGYITWTDGVNFTYDEGNADNHGLIRLGTKGNINQGNIKGFYV